MHDLKQFQVIAALVAYLPSGIIVMLLMGSVRVKWMNKCIVIGFSGKIIMLSMGCVRVKWIKNYSDWEIVGIFFANKCKLKGLAMLKYYAITFYHLLKQLPCHFWVFIPKY